MSQWSFKTYSFNKEYKMNKLQRFLKLNLNLKDVAEDNVVIRKVLCYRNPILIIRYIGAVTRILFSVGC